jgi:aquaporin Z
MVGAFAVGGISGGVFNPAVDLGGTVMGLFSWPVFVIYLVVEVIAGAIAGLVFRGLNSDDK